jgi:hypothetical protein
MFGQFRPEQSIVNRPPGLGRVFFVSAAGDNGNNGVDPGTPFQTITYALTQCTTGNHDYIIVMNNTSAVEPAFPIDIDIDFLHIIGYWGMPYPSPTLAATDDNPTFRLVDGSTWIEIGGIDFGGGATNGCIQIGSGAGNTSYCWIHDCSFGYDASTAQDGIRWLATHADAQTFVEDCIFGAGLTRDCLRLDGNNTRGIFRRNMFRDIQGIGINVNVNGADLGGIFNNTFSVPIADAAAAGWAITFVLGAGTAQVMNNYASETGDDTGNNPYRDLSTGVLATSLNAWGLNYENDTPTDPAIA